MTTASSNSVFPKYILHANFTLLKTIVPMFIKDLSAYCTMTCSTTKQVPRVLKNNTSRVILTAALDPRTRTTN